MKNEAEINARIAELERELEEVQGTPTEIYTRIVGYYRSLKNWNRGKREEYRHRRTFDVEVSLEGKPSAEESASTESGPMAVELPSDRGTVARILFFSREHCPNCPPMRAALDGAHIVREEIDVDTDSGFELARRHEILATPTVLMLDEAGEEVRRVTDPLILKEELQETA